MTSPRLALDAVLIRDRYQLQRDFIRLGSIRDADEQAARTADLHERIKRSEELVALRRAASPPVTYPEELPITACIDELRAAITNHQVVILAGETGSGKTTQIPKLCLQMGRGIFGTIGHTQPRRLAARTVARRLCQELKVGLGQQVGYAVRFQDQVSETTLVKLMTDGILLNELTRDRWLNQYDTLIIDEAHERSLNIDFLLGYLKTLLPKRPELKLIVTSATIDVARFSQHFSNAPVIEVSGRGYPVDVVYVEPTPNEDDEAPEVGQQIATLYNEIIAHEAVSGGAGAAPDILVFLAGEREILEAAQYLRKAKLKFDPEVLPLYARLSNTDQERVFSPGTSRRIVLATNVAETSLTVPRIGYVIDPGFARISRYSARSKLQRLPIEAISKASAEQRKGRCGRVAPGICFRLYSMEDFAARPDYTDAEILRTNLAAVVLQTRALRLGDLAEFPLIDPPESRAVRDAERLLEELQALADRKLTRIGHQLARLPVDPRLGRMLLSSVARGCLREVLIIVSALAVQDPRERPAEAKQAADQAHAEWRHQQSDFLSFVNLWDWVEAQRQSQSKSAFRRLCKQRYLSWLRLQEWRDTHRQLLLAMHEMNYRANTQPAEFAQIHESLLAGLLGNAGIRVDRYEYLGARGSKFQLFPGSALFSQRPNWVAAAEIVETARVYARCVAAIQPQWLEHAGSHLLKREHNEPRWDRKKGAAIASERATLYGLPIYEKRPVLYARIDVLESRRLLIRHGLVFGELDRLPVVIRGNLKLVAELHEIEERLRTRDLVVDEDALAAFYDERLPPDILDARALEQFCRDAGERLRITREELMRRAMGANLDIDFPTSIQWRDVTYDLIYRFAPGEEHDGVTLRVPIGLLNDLDVAELSWFVPGYRDALVESWVKSLPRHLRRELGPFPELIRDLAGYPFESSRRESRRHFLLVLGDALKEHRNVHIPIEAWDIDRVHSHLRFFIEVLDENKRVLVAGRDLQQLRAQLQKRPSSNDWNQVRASLEAAQIDKLPTTPFAQRLLLETRQGKVLAFPALVVEGDSVALRLLDSEDTARHAHLLGATRLLRARLGKEWRQAVQVPAFEQARLRFATFGGALDLEDQLLRALAGRALADVRDLGALESLAEGIRGRLRQSVAELAKHANDVLWARAENLEWMDTHPSPAFKHAYDDSRELLALMVPPDFLDLRGPSRLDRLARMVRANLHRLQQLQGRVERDSNLVLELQRSTRRLMTLPADQCGDLLWQLWDLRAALMDPSYRPEQKTSLVRLGRSIEEVEARVRMKVRQGS